MNLREIDNLEKIVTDSYSKPGEGILLSHMWYVIELYNQDYSTHQKNLALIKIVEDLMKKGLVKINKIYSKGDKKPYWDRSYLEYIESLENFLLNVPPKELEENDPEVVFVRFDYEFVDWQVDSIDDLKKLMSI